MRRIAWPLAAAALFAAGCGMEPVNTRIQARAESGLDQYPLEVVEGKYMCPHVVSINGQPFDVKAVISGEVDDQFGPFVASGVPVSGAPGSTGTCDVCKGEYRIPTGDEDPDAEPTGDEPPMALPMLRSPHDSETYIDPVALFVKGSKDSLLGPSVCPTTKRNFTIKETDLLTTIDVHEEILDPAGKPIDPTVNSDASGKKVVRLMSDFEGPCWRGGGTGMIPVWGEDGGMEECPECDGTGFTTYEGSLPKSYTAWGREQALPSKSRKWKHKRDAPSGGGGGGGEDLGPPEDSGDGGGDPEDG